MAELEDKRRTVYEDLHHGPLRELEDGNRYSAAFILTKLFHYYPPKSILDVGCGLGTWLEVAQQCGVSDVLGIEGDWLDRKLVIIPPERIVNLDLEKSFDLGRRFDLVISLEVGEHLSERAAAGFVASLVRHAPVVLFSAAIPFQGGHHHVNEQFLPYWSRLFDHFGYQPVDFLRSIRWNNPNILLYLRQNIVIFARQELTKENGPFASLMERNGPLSIVHPDMYHERCRAVGAILDEHNRLLSLLASGITFSATRNEKGQLTIQRLS